MTKIKENFRSLLQSGLTKLNLVTREEFDIQANVLARTRQKLEALEKRVALLENKESEPHVPSDHS